MFKKANGFWKSDFRLNGKRYQHTWEVKDKNEALKLEKDLKEKIKNNINILIKSNEDEKLNEAKKLTQTILIETSKLLELFLLENITNDKKKDIKNKVSNIALHLSALTKITETNIEINSLDNKINSTKNTYLS